MQVLHGEKIRSYGLNSTAALPWVPDLKQLLPLPQTPYERERKDKEMTALTILTFWPVPYSALVPVLLRAGPGR